MGLRCVRSVLVLTGIFSFMITKIRVTLKEILIAYPVAAMVVPGKVYVIPVTVYLYPVPQMFATISISIFTGNGNSRFLHYHVEGKGIAVTA